MKIIVDCGGTKGDWRYIDADGLHSAYDSPGFNPVLKTEEQISEIIQTHLPRPAESVSAVYYYGAGAEEASSKQMLRRVLANYFDCQNCEVNSDLLASCRAASGQLPALVSILGTGSSSCSFDGEKIIDKVPYLGFIAGDEGSGTAIGKSLLQAYFYREMPAHIQLAFEKAYQPVREVILQGIYKNPAANTYLASFTQFAIDHLSDPFITDLVRTQFNRFIHRHLMKYQGNESLPTHFIGSVAWYFRDILKSALDTNGLLPGQIIRKPIDSLIEFHIKQPA